MEDASDSNADSDSASLSDGDADDESLQRCRSGDEDACDAAALLSASDAAKSDDEDDSLQRLPIDDEASQVCDHLGLFPRLSTVPQNSQDHDGEPMTSDPFGF